MKISRAPLVGLLLLCAVLSHAQGSHDVAFWRSIAKNKYAVPANESADALAHEVSGLLALPDPELRDDLAYSILARWIHRGYISNAAAVQLTDEWRANLKTGIGENGTNSVLKRSFSALCLASMAEREARAPFMGAERYHALVAEAAAYLQGERDLRGYDTTLHWIHATAHTADLLGELAGSSLLTHNEAAAILAAIDARLNTATVIYTQGEQDRLASAVVAVIRRSDFDNASFAPWLARIENEDRDVWTTTTVEALTRYQNHTYTLQSLVVRLLLEPESPRLAEAREQIMKILRSRA